MPSAPHTLRRADSPETARILQQSAAGDARRVEPRAVEQNPAVKARFPSKGRWRYPNRHHRRYQSAGAAVAVAGSTAVAVARSTAVAVARSTAVAVAVSTAPTPAWASPIIQRKSIELRRHHRWVM